MIECKNLTNGLRIATSGAYFACCHTFNHPFLDDNGEEMMAGKHSIQDALESPTRLKMMDDFKNNTRHPACVVCWSAEDAGFKSKRERDNQTYSYNMTNRKDSDIFFLELNLGNTCNLACRICHISASSKWKDHHHVIEPDLTEERLNDYVRMYSKSFTEDSVIWEQLMEVLPQIRSLDIYGGEPMLMKKQWEILEESVNRGYSKRQQMSFNTNGTIINERYLEILTSFEHSRIGFSIDGINERFEYLRYHGIWEVVKENVGKWKEKVKNKPHADVRFEVCCTISMLNVYYVFEIVDYVIENKISLYISFLHNPPHLHIGNIPENYKKVVIDELTSKLEESIIKYQNCSDEDREHIRLVHHQAEKIISTLKLPVDYNPIHWSEFIRQTNELDVLRNQSFTETFPELSQIYNFEKETKIYKRKIL